jgi:hypothetical protein
VVWATSLDLTLGCILVAFDGPATSERYFGVSATNDVVNLCVPWHAISKECPEVL